MLYIKLDRALEKDSVVLQGSEDSIRIYREGFQQGLQSCGLRVPLNPKL